MVTAVESSAALASPSSHIRSTGSLRYHLGVLADAPGGGGGRRSPSAERSEAIVAKALLWDDPPPVPFRRSFPALCDAAARGPLAAELLARVVATRPAAAAPRLDLVWAAVAGAFAADDARLRAGAFAVLRAAGSKWSKLVSISGL